MNSIIKSLPIPPSYEGGTNVDSCSPRRQPLPLPSKQGFNVNDSTFVWNIQWLHLHFVLGCALYKMEVGELHGKS
ncbi:hypothetical protein LG52_1037 [Geobacillus kaustophilus]|uniref:Uncharacterized protein n=1 Tax=Geobacillus kaustophilus TaxID=1462 RepID=A0A0D8BSQ9_GEOKU|nr:hypothetical protein LG52_1037 [Geobacillus kaustophilus]